MMMRPLCHKAKSGPERCPEIEVMKVGDEIKKVEKAKLENRKVEKHTLSLTESPLSCSTFHNEKERKSTNEKWKDSGRLNFHNFDCLVGQTV